MPTPPFRALAELAHKNQWSDADAPFRALAELAHKNKPVTLTHAESPVCVRALPNAIALPVGPGRFFPGVVQADFARVFSLRRRGRRPGRAQRNRLPGPGPGVREPFTNRGEDASRAAERRGRCDWDPAGDPTGDGGDDSGRGDERGRRGCAPGCCVADRRHPRPAGWRAAFGCRTGALGSTCALGPGAGVDAADRYRQLASPCFGRRAFRPRPGIRRRFRRAGACRPGQARAAVRCDGHSGRGARLEGSRQPRPRPAGPDPRSADCSPTWRCPGCGSAAWPIMLRCWG